MKKIYFAAPLFNEMELKRNKEITKKLRSWGYDVYLPQENAGLSAKIIAAGGDIYGVSRKIFQSDIEGIKKCDILIFFLDGRVPDEGACVELGMAYAWNKICLGYKTDDRCLDFTGTDNLFIEGCMNFEISHNLNELKSKLECIK